MEGMPSCHIKVFHLYLHLDFVYCRVGQYWCHNILKIESAPGLMDKLLKKMKPHILLTVLLIFVILSTKINLFEWSYPKKFTIFQQQMKDQQQQLD